ncbi:ribonuclease HII [Gottfriedia luciferensis]|uniref:ribonuclease HII n=1 Tax=Gottfriedia luciferensis TaxID=178774 RepID=UPI000B4485A6|nr:ribonuclease HII [Gottfriedia luciferensis]
MSRKIDEIKNILNELTDSSSELFIEFKNDQRVGVQKLIAKWYRDQEKRELARNKFLKMMEYEQNLYKQNIKLIAGVDEVGRGPLAGPVVAAAVILAEETEFIGLDDSKKLSKEKRQYFVQRIKNEAVSYGIGMASSTEIDEINIYEATKLAMKRAIEQLNHTPEHLLIDAMKLPIDISQTSIIKGDATSISIAAASVLAKETRDELMVELSLKHPNYGFEKHMGYGTKEHLQAIENYGIIDEHRKSFAPIKGK